MADTAALVVALSAQLTKFEKDMQKAGIMAEKAVGDIENKFAKANPKISTSFFGNLFADLASQALRGAIEGVKELFDRFTDLQKIAELTEISIQWIYGLQEAGMKAGASFGEINTALRAVAFSLDEMKRGGDNALKTLFEANPKFLKGVKVDALDAAGALKIVSDIMANMSKLRAVDVAKNLGLPEGTVELWRQGGAAVKDYADKAAAAAPDLQELARVNKEFEASMRGVWEYIKGTIVDNIIPAFKDALRSLIESMQQFQKVFKNGPLDMANAIEGLQQFEKKLEGTRVLIQTPAKPGDGSGVNPFARKGGGGGGGERDAFQRANDQITKHIALLEAEAVSIGKSAYEQERLKTVTLLQEAERRRLNLAEGAAIPINEELARKIQAQAEAAGRAAQKSAEAHKEFSELSAMSSQFGSLLSSSFADAVVEGKKLDEVFKDLTKSLLKMAINTTIMNLFNPQAGGQASPFLSLFGVGKNAGGTNNWRGGMTMVGEQGPELVNLPRGSQVVPADATRNMMNGGGGSITYAPAIDARGASVEAVARLARIIETDRAMFASRTVATIQQARRARVAGL